MKISGALAMIKSLEKENVKIIFGYPGAAICPFYDALLETSSITHILTRHEQGAAHAASGYARVTGKVGVCVATSGPGSTNLITGIATAYMDSIPIVIITGQVSTDQIGKDVFQEADTTGATEPFCKHSYLVKNVHDIPRIFKEAFYIASTGRPGPVLIDMPVDIQKKELVFDYPNEININGYKPTIKGHEIQIQRVAKAIENARSPVICCGGGVVSANASEELTSLIDKCGIPVVNTLMGKGAIASSHELYIGMIGSHGAYASNYAVNNADLLILIGTRASDRAMGANKKVMDKSQVVHIDVDPAEIGKNIQVNIPVVGDIKDILKSLNEIIKHGDTKEWIKNILSVKTQNKTEFTNKEGYICPKYLLNVLSDEINSETIITTEVGQNQIWAANNIKIEGARRFITSGGMGTMGYGLPAAVGIKFAKPDSKVVVISGDGSFQMGMQELGTMKQYDLDIKIILFNNDRLGMVREIQKNMYNKRYSQVLLEKNPDFVKLVEAYGFKGERIDNNDSVPDALKKMMQSEGAYLLECIVDPDESTL